MILPAVTAAAVTAGTNPKTTAHAKITAKILFIIVFLLKSHNFNAISAIILLYCEIRSKSTPFYIKIVSIKGVLIVKPRSNEPGTKNIIGSKVAAIRKERGIKQKDFLAQLQVQGLDISATGLSRLEGQYRLVHDYEIVALARVLKITADELLYG
jgi:hypothetical protein